MDDLAFELGIEPLELRERNWISHEEFPYTTIAGLTYDSGNYEAATARAKELFGYDELRVELFLRRASPERSSTSPAPGRRWASDVRAPKGDCCRARRCRESSFMRRPK